jgi:CheY-like chemotaxis protein
VSVSLSVLPNDGTALGVTESDGNAVAKILLAECNAKIRLLTKSLIETRDGWLVTEAMDGHDAIAKVAKLRPDLVVLDFAMPVLNGFETAARISKHFPNLPIILYTFYGFEAMSTEAKKHGIREVVDKTASGDILLETIARHIRPATTSYPEPSAGEINSNDKKEPNQLT